MPYHGLIPFLHVIGWIQVENDEGFNALPRAHPISTLTVLSSGEFVEEFQCPTTGSSHFYMMKKMTIALMMITFQCPTTGSSHFYGIPSQTPIKPAFPGTISGGISQNILKIKVLPTKNGMFTICSYFTCFYSTIIPIFMQAVILLETPLEAQNIHKIFAKPLAINYLFNYTIHKFVCSLRCMVLVECNYY